MVCKKIGIDFHGVFNSNTQFFKDFCAYAAEHGLEIHIISGGPKETIEKFLTLHKIQYTAVWCIFDYFDAKSEVEFLPDGSFHVDDEKWDSAKAEYCRRNDICVQIDDSTIYGRYFTTPYCLYDERNKEGLLKDMIIDFSGAPKDCLQKILLLLL